MDGNSSFVSPLDLAKKLRTRIESPVDVLMSLPCLGQPVVVYRGHGTRIRRLSRFLYHLSLGGGMLVSVALNQGDADSFMGFKKIVLHRRLGSVYYCVDIHT